MASITKYRDGYRAQIKKRGVRESETFRTQREARVWAAQREAEIDALAANPTAMGARMTLADVLVRYRDEVIDEHRGARWERLRIEAMLRPESLLPLRVPLAGLGPESFHSWRDARKRVVRASSVLREITIITAALESARREWRWIAENPIRDMRRPSAPDHRTRIIQRHEVRAMLRAMGHRARGVPRSVTEACALAFLLALHTGMRAGEICALRWADVGTDYCRLPQTKTTPRDVPLEPAARRVIERMRGFDAEWVFGIHKSTLDALFRRARKNAGLDGFTFHDARHTAATRLAQRLQVLDLCKMFGWADPKRAMTYYNPTASQIAERLRRGRG